MQFIRLLLSSLLFSLLATIAIAQEFEGFIEYKIEPTFPSEEFLDKVILDSLMNEILGPNKYFTKEYYYKAGKYLSEIKVKGEMGYELYNPKNGLLYAWKQDADTALTRNTTTTIDKFLSITEHNAIDTILEIPCKSFTVKTLFGSITTWYNAAYFPVKAAYFEAHLFNGLNSIIGKTNSLPIKIVAVGFNGSYVQTAIAFKQFNLPDTLFTIPDFKVVSTHPIN